MQPVAVREVKPKEVVEVFVVGRAEIFSIPPEPVASLCDVHLFPGQGMGIVPFFLQVSSRPGEHLPGLPVLVMTDPYGEVVVDPRPGIEADDALVGGFRSRKSLYREVSPPGFVQLHRAASKPLAAIRVILQGFHRRDDRNEGIEVTPWRPWLYFSGT